MKYGKGREDVVRIMEKCRWKGWFLLRKKLFPYSLPINNEKCFHGDFLDENWLMEEKKINDWVLLFTQKNVTPPIIASIQPVNWSFKCHPHARHTFYTTLYWVGEGSSVALCNPSRIRPGEEDDMLWKEGYNFDSIIYLNFWIRFGPSCV